MHDMNAVRCSIIVRFQVGVIGLGLMGHGIGLVSAQGGYEVVGIETKKEALEAGKKRITASLNKLLSKVGRCATA